MINLSAALSAFNSAGIDPQGDSDTLTSSQIEVVLQQADLAGYRKPKNANGSRARYFFYAVQRKHSAQKRGDK